MALGAITEIAKGVMGDRKYAILDVQLTSGANYADNGEAFDYGLVPGFNLQIDFVSAEAGVPTTPAVNGIVVVWDRAAKKLVYFQGDNAAVAAGPLIEVAANTDLSTSSARLFVVGK